MPSVPVVALAEVARLSDGDADPAHVLHRIVDRATSLVPGCTAAGLTVLTREGEESAALTDDRVQRCHDVQFGEDGEGPAREAMRFREPRRSDDLACETRWPRFVEAARGCGFGGCLALPLHSDRTGASALNLYADEPGTFAGTTFDVALLFAAQGGVAVDNAALYRQNREMVEHLHRTLTTRSLIERAKGVLMSRLQLSNDDAFAALRDESQASHRKLADVALAVLEQQDPGVRHEDTTWTPPRHASHRSGATTGR